MINSGPFNKTKDFYNSI